jgi:RNA polymerase sigma-70 factor, ECF subfamily
LPLAGDCGQHKLIQDRFMPFRTLAMPDADSFADLIDGLHRGDQRAAALIFERFARRLIGLAHEQLRMDVVVRHKVDPEDVMQSAFKSFFVHQAQGAYELDDWNSLWSLLARITLRKCHRRFEEFRAACRDVRREEGSANDSSFECPAPGRDPTPSEAAILAETVESLMRELRPRERDILALSLQGHSHAEISASVGCTERTVYRVLQHVGKRLEEMVAGEPDGKSPT